jgi:hypothetical protein
VVCEARRRDIYRVNWFSAIINIVFLKNAITIQVTASVPLQFRSCLKDAIMYAKQRIGPTCKHTGDSVFSYGQDYALLSSLSFH